ncbi:MAG: carboxypeptidase regulatory-like domain-containing protein [Bacteroidota bacterium]
MIGLAVPEQVLIIDKRSKPRRQLADLAYFQKNNLIVSDAGNTTAENKAGIYEIELSKIHIIKALFQNRKADFSQESVNKIKKAYFNGVFSWANFDPLTLWKSEDKYFILSGHSRFQACKELAEVDKQFLKIPCKIFLGSQAEAEKIALESNTLSTKETETERANFYRRKREAGSSKKELKELAKDLEGKDANKIIALSYLSESGDALTALTALDLSDVQSKSVLLTFCVWIGTAKEQYMQLTTAHENEIFKYLVNGGYGSQAGQINNQVDFLNKMYSIIQKNTMFGEFEQDKPLNINRTIYKDDLQQQYERELNDLTRAIKDATKLRDSKRIELLQRNATEEQFKHIMQNYDNEIFALTKKLADHRKKESTIFAAAANQQSMFGIAGPNTGIVRDESGKPLQFVNVYETDSSGKPLYNGSILIGTTTNAAGLFTLNINKAVYYITASYVGLEKQTILVVTANQFLNFTLKASTLEPVTITANRVRNYGLLALLGILIFNS